MSDDVRAPAQPVYILRGHTAQIHALHFYHNNLRLLTGDADGWVVIWSLVSRRPLAVWRAHEKSILALKTWGNDQIITHGRDDALRVWHIPTAAEDSLSKQLPAEGYALERRSPWLLHSLLVNTMNFCAMSICTTLDKDSPTAEDERLVFAVPGTQDGYIHIHELPSEKCIHVVPPSPSITRSLVMAIRLYTSHGALFVVTGNEAGETSVQTCTPETKIWSTLYSYRAHAQPILSLDIALSQARYFTSSADALIASHPLPLSQTPSHTNTNSSDSSALVAKTGHAGQQSLCVRNDGRIFATAGWDARMRVYSARGAMRELAVLKWHKEGCHAVAFASVAGDSSEAAAGAGSEGDGRVIPADPSVDSVAGEGSRQDGAAVADESIDGTAVQRQSGRRLTVQQRREESTRTTHWLAAGAKDGKVSLWDIF